MKRRVALHPSAIDHLRHVHGSARSILRAGLEQLAADGDALEAREDIRLRGELVPLRKLRLGQLRIVFGFTTDQILVLALGNRDAGKSPDFYGQLAARIEAGDFDDELDELRAYAASRPDEPPAGT